MACSDLARALLAAGLILAAAGPRSAGAAAAGDPGVAAATAPAVDAAADASADGRGSSPVDAEITITRPSVAPEEPSVGASAPGPRRRRSGLDPALLRRTGGGAGAAGSANASAPAAKVASPARPAPPVPAAALAPAAAALGEGWTGSGTLHLPGVGGRAAVLDAASTPFVELGDGRRLILDVGGKVPPALAAAIEGRWPGNRVLSFPAGAHPREVLGAVLASSGYAAVAPGAPIVFGREVRVRLRPDFVVLKGEDDLVLGTTRAVSVVDAPGDEIPEELREMAAGHRIQVAEIPRDPAAAPPPAWRDPVGRVTTVETASRALVIAEVAEAAGVPAGGAAHDDPAAGAALNNVPTVGAAQRGGPAGVPPADAASDLRIEVGEVLAAGGAKAIGPTVDFSRPTAAGGPSRFTVSVPGWLVEREGRKLLVTGASLAAPLRLLLTREGIDVLEYRLRR